MPNDFEPQVSQLNNYVVANHAVDLERCIRKFHIDVNIPVDGRSLISIAAERRSWDCFQILLKHGADPNQPDPRRFTPLSCVINQHRVEDISYLKQNGASLDTVDSHGNSQLMKVVAARETALANELIILGCDLNLTNNYGLTALDLARRYRHDDLVDILRKRRASGTGATVLVLGAGFTRGFCKDSPLMAGDWLKPEDLKTLSEDPTTKTIVNYCKTLHKDFIDVELLFSRLSENTPFDDSLGNSEKLNAARQLVLRSIVDKLRATIVDDEAVDKLSSLAEKIIAESVDVITFNYDEVLDEAIARSSVQNDWNPTPSGSLENGRETIEWNPQFGYGFLARLSHLAKGDYFPSYSLTPTNILKLHGSLNWRREIGDIPRLALSQVVVRPKWHMNKRQANGSDVMDGQLHDDPIIVPPTMSKSGFHDYPVIQQVWKNAYSVLQQADRIIFVGYSLPLSDTTTAFLFREALASNDNLPEIQVVDFMTKKPVQDELKYRFTKVFDGSNISFRFDGTVEWAKEFINEQRKVTYRSNK
ncbi:MAG: ankyrin repeat domain-containing protein [Chthonomonadales bacterium]